MKREHYFLGFGKRNNGAFEHSWNLAKNLKSRGYSLTFFANWFDSSIEEIKFTKDGGKIEGPSSLNNLEGIFHLQTHTWEYNNFLEDVYKNPKSKLIFYLHAIIPYFYMDRKTQKYFLEGNFSKSELDFFISKNLSSREKSQLRAISKSDHLVTISKNHKKAIENLGFKKNISVLENVTDFVDLDGEILEKGKRKAEELRDYFSSKNVILYCGNLYGNKGANSLFDSFKKIKYHYPSSSLVILGVGNGEISRLQKYGFEDLW